MKLMLDCYNRPINYLRISVTDLCNLRCTYCMPEEGIEQISHTEILSFEELRDITEVAVKLGVSKVRLTGANHWCGGISFGWSRCFPASMVFMI
jgi:cyclic pyranopterin phosphate synthase